jgi:hypothetical protein
MAIENSASVVGSLHPKSRAQLRESTIPPSLRCGSLAFSGSLPFDPAVGGIAAGKREQIANQAGL